MAWVRHVAAGIAITLFAAHTSGCGAACTRSNEKNPPKTYDGGVSDGTEYQSAPTGGPYLSFPGGSRYEILHKLDPPPTLGTVEIRLAFDKDGSTADTAGNQAIVQEITAEHILVKNDTCADFFLYVYARASSL